MKKALAIGLATVMAVSMSAPVFAEDEGKGIAKEDLKVGVHLYTQVTTAKVAKVLQRKTSRLVQSTSAMRTKVTQQLIWLVSMKCRRHLALTIHRLLKKL